MKKRFKDFLNKEPFLKATIDPPISTGTYTGVISGYGITLDDGTKTKTIECGIRGKSNCIIVVEPENYIKLYKIEIMPSI